MPAIMSSEPMYVSAINTITFITPVTLKPHWSVFYGRLTIVCLSFSQSSVLDTMINVLLDPLSIKLITPQSVTGLCLFVKQNMA